MASGRIGAALAVVALAFLVAVGYGAALQNGYVWDDRFFLRDYRVVTGYAQAWRAAFEPLFGLGGYVRPLPLFLLYVEGILGGHQARLSHAVNLAIHLACACLVYVLARRATNHAMASSDSLSRWMLPLLMASLFAIHPALSEAVVWVASRFDLMATFFMLLALCAWTSRLSAWPRALLVTLCFFLGALCKESVVVLPVVLAIVSMVDRAAQAGKSGSSLDMAFARSDLLAYGLMFCAGLVYLALRFHVLSGAEGLVADGDSAGARWSRFGISTLKYIKMTAVPFVGLSPQHTFNPDPAGSALSLWLPPLLAVALILAVFIKAVRGSVVCLVLGAWFFSYMPVLHILPLHLGGNLVQQRFMYFPTALLLALMPYATAGVRVSPLAKRALWLLSGALILGSVLTVRSIVPMWASDLTLWEWTVRADPHSRIARENLIWSYVDHDRLEDAKAQMDTMLGLGMPVGARVALNMGSAYYKRADYEAALYYYEAAMTTRLTSLPPSSRAGLYSNVAVANAMLGHADEARVYIVRALDEKGYGTTPLANYLAFCAGRSKRIGEFDPSEVRRAIPTIRGVTRLLVARQPDLYAAGDFCPESPRESVESQ